MFALGGGYWFGGRRGLKYVAAALVGLGLVAGGWAQQTVTTITEPPVPLLPPSFGEWKSAPTGSTTGATLSLVSVNKDALEECGPERSKVADYTRGGRNVHVEAVQFKDRTGAFSAYTLVKRPDMVPQKDLGANAAAGENAVLFTVGTSVVLVSPASAADLGSLKPLALGMPKAMGNSGLAPMLPQLVPSAGLVDGSVRYSLGPATYMAEGGILPANSLGWDKEAEGVTAEYKDQRGNETLTLLLYPTPAIAGTYTRMVQDLVGALGPSSGTAKVRREGPLVLLATGSFAPDEAQKVLENIHIKAIVSNDQDITPSAHTQIVQTYSLLTNIAILAGVLMGGAVLLGIFLGGGRALFRMARGKSAASEPEFLSLHLDPQNEAAKFTPTSGSGAV